MWSRGMLLLGLLDLGWCGAAAQSPFVTSISPSVGSRNGGTRITVHGENFADSFDLNGDPNVGTHTKLVAGSEYDCDLHIDGVTNVTATCYTKAMPEGDYEVRVTVDGVPVTDYCTSSPSSCVFTVRDSSTPKIYTLTPRSGVPGTLLTADAKLFTSRYGSNEESQNSRTEKIVKFWAAGKICNVKNLDTDTYYGLELTLDSNGNGDDGFFKCVPDNEYIGNYNVSFIVEGAYGRSLPESTLLHVHTNGVGMYQMYTEIEGLSASSGSTEGGLLLTVTGKYFDDTDSPARVTIGGSTCTVQEPISTTKIVCQTPAEPSTSASQYTGNRGLELTTVDGTTDFNTATWSSGNTSRVDETYHATVNVSSHVRKMAGVFTAPETGTFRFYLKSDGSSKMTLSSFDTSSDLVSVTSSSYPRRGNGAESATVSLQKGTNYKMEILSGHSTDSRVEVAARHYETVYTATQTGAAEAEIQKLDFASVVEQEVQRLVVTSTGTATGQGEVQQLTVTGDLSDKFIVGVDGAYTEPLAADATDGAALAIALSKLPSLAGDAVAVTDTQDATSRTYTLTFPASRGNVAQVVGQPATSASSLAARVTTTTEGQSTLEYFQLKLRQHPFQANRCRSRYKSCKKTVKTAIEGEAGVRCPDAFSNGQIADELARQRATCSGERVGHEEPFCGRFSRPRTLARCTGDTRMMTVTLLARPVDAGAWRLRMPQARPNNAFIERVTVTGSAGDYTISLYPYLCGNTFRLFEVQGSRVSGNNGTGSNSATLSMSSGGKQLSVEVTRQTRASPPIGGTFTVSFNGQTSQAITVTPDLESEVDVVRDKLSLIQGLGDVDVTFNGNCAAFSYTVTMATKAGNQNEMTIGATRLTGNSVTTSVITEQDGSLWYRPIPGDMLSTVHASPQVVVHVNDVPLACASGVDCGFTWSSGSGDSVTITGTGFAGSGDVVTVGGATCSGASGSSTSLTCTLSVGPNGAQSVRVNVPGKGLASGSVTFTYTSTVSSISPTSGSLEGGFPLTVSGQGFTSSAVVTVGGATCDVTSSSVTELVCTVPAAASGSAGAATVTVTQGGTTLTSPTDFTYSSAETPVVSSVSAINGNVWGGEVITIAGSRFGTNTPDVRINGTQLRVTSNSDVEIVAETPPLNPGSHGLQLLVGGRGLADTRTNAIPNIDIKLVVTGMTPAYGSMYGGTIMTLTGQGFGDNSSRVDVTLGGHACPIDTISDTQITCKLAYTGTEHTVTNQGTHKDYGTGYAFEPKHLSVMTGDCVTWQWTTPSFVSGIAYGIKQTATDTAKTTLANGFESPGANTANGQYRFCFTEPGDYFYWSGYVNSPYNTVYLRGQVTVTQRTSSLADLRLTVGGIEAGYNTAAASSPSSSSACSPVSGKISGCSPTVEPVPNADKKFQFVFHECATPVIRTISRSNGTSQDTVTFTGTGFGSQDCQNEITYASVGSGVVTSSSDSSLSFTVGTAGPPPVAVLEEFKLRVGNRGNALVAIANDGDRRFALLPVISNMTPYRGSLAGGTTVTFTGSGFATTATDNAIAIDGAQCVIQTATATEVTCLTPSTTGSSSKQATVDFSTVAGGNTLPTECKASYCSFLYDSNITPALTSVTPTTISAAATTVTISGSGFGTTSADVTVTLGGSQCTVTRAVDAEIVCTTGDVPAGNHIPQVSIGSQGLAKADNSHAVTSEATIASIAPLEGSTNGGTVVTITGHGFKPTSVVTIDGVTCNVTSETATVITCVTSAHAAGAVDLIVTSNGVTYPSQTFTYSAGATPSVTSVTPAQGQAGDSVVIAGTGFSGTGGDNTVTVGGVAATVTSPSTTSLTVTLGNQMTGSFAVLVDVSGSGLSNNDVMFEYTLGAVTISPTTGTTAGGQTLTVTGSGFLPGGTDVTICGVACNVVSGSTTTSSQHLCTTPAKTTAVSVGCNVEVSVNSVTQVATPQYTYDPSITPEITGVNPRRGGTAGGTLLTITGTGFGAASGDTKVDVNVNGAGSALQTDADFQFIDVWSSPFTWGGASPPVAGDLVVIPKGQILLLDNSTEKLSMLLIQGTLIFDEMNLELHADNILITDGGTLQVGTEANPFPEQYTALIKLYGHPRSRELPIYGAKVLALRNGTLDLHGHPTPVTWTHLASTAAVGATQITLTTRVNWKVGDQIVLPSTGHRHTQIQNEVHVISAISGDQLTLTLQDPLVYEHVVAQHTFVDGSSVDLRGEVGLLSHNVKVQGSVHDEWTETIPRCEAGFDTGEFATQTCFQGRFGAESGSDQYGAHIIAHAAAPDTNEAVVRLSYIEISHAGQAFRMGRYPVHLHLNGDMSGSYVRGLGIHNSFNRAVNVHGTNNALVEHTVLYNIMGGAFFLEDGIETGNTFQYNLGVFVRPSSSLRNDDITPATFWVTNPNNNIIHNAAAGGSHFGYWYRMHDHPEGPSFDSSVCPKKVPLGRFENNTAHSFGWFGLWIFEDYFPHQNGACSGTPTQVAIFKTLTAWNCEKGAETVNTGALQFKDFILVNNEKAGWEGKQLGSVPQYDETNGPMVDGGKIVAHLDNKLDQEGNHACTSAGVVLPYQNGLIVRGVQFYNFDRSGCAAFAFTRITGTCSFLCGGFTYITKLLQFENSANKVSFGWQHEGVLRDEDGTLTGSAGYAVIPDTPTLPTANCQFSVAGMSMGTVPGAVCNNTVKFHRFSFNNPMPKNLEGKEALFTNQHGTSYGYYAKKRITHPKGWMIVLVDGECYELVFENAGQIQNVSYDGVYYQFDVGDTLCVTQNAIRPDRFIVDGGTHINMSDPLPTPAAASHGDWYYDETAGKVSYYIKRMSKRRKRGVISYNNDLSVDFRAYRCYYDNCIPPPNPVTVSITPGNAIPWSQLSSWDWRPEGKPVAGDNVTIPGDKWLIIDEPIPQLDFLVIEGGLSAASDASLSFTIDVNYIFISGRLAIGWDNEPFNGTAKILLRGSHSSPNYPTTSGPELGAKFIGVFGGLDLHGVDPGVKWSRLASTANAGDTTLTLEDTVTWAVGDEVMVTTTDARPWHTETFKLTNVAGNVLTLNSSVQYRHIAHTETLSNGYTLKMTARVALLTRNIVIEGADYPEMETESFGARILVGKTVYNGESGQGFARVENTEFYRTGQEGFVMPYDPRFSLAFVDVLSDITTDYYSYVRNNAFHNGFSPAVGVFSVDNMEVTGIQTNSAGTRIENNLVALTIWPGAYQDREESFNFEFDGAIDAMDATGLILRNNIVAGSERMGYHTAAQECTTTGRDVWSGNEAHSCLFGTGLLPRDTPISSTCTMWAGYTLWKNADSGVYVQTGANQVFKDIISVDNAVGLASFNLGPAALSHQYQDKRVDVQDSVFTGRTSTYDCTLDKPDSTDDNIRLSSVARSWRHGSCGVTGVAFPTFTSGSNKCPEKPCYGVMSYQAIKGFTLLQNVTFEDFGTDGTSRDYAISTNPKQDDGNHQVNVRSLVLNNVDAASKVFFHNPNVGKINPSDCVDMDCDAMKKAMVVDEDGSLLGGTGGYVLPNAGFEWNGDPRRGIGDYRIPKVALTAQDGSRIPVSTRAPNKGIYGYDNCTWQSDWNAYQCDDSNKYAMLVIESMDVDTETRRLSPVAVIAGGYIDLINGPQDHGWCSGYTCRKRLSTFQALVPLDKWVELFMSSTVPQRMRFMLLNVAPTECVGLSIWKAQPHRLDIYVDGQYIMPTNGHMAAGRFFVKTEDYRDQYMPSLANKTMGDNYIRFYENTLFWTQCGPGELEFRTADVLIVSFGLPAMTNEEFYGEQIVNNLAQFLSVPIEKVRVVNVVRETSSGRRKRQTGTTYFYIEISNIPTDNSTIVDLVFAADKIVTQVQLYGMDDVLNATVLYTAIREPSAGADASFSTLQKVGSLVMATHAVGAKEGHPFSVQPVLQVQDQQGNVVDYLGAIDTPWQVEAVIKSGGGGQASFIGNTSVTFVNGTATFSGLGIDRMGDYVITFNITHPPEAANYSLDSLTVSVSGRGIRLRGQLISGTIINAPLQLQFHLEDTDTGDNVSDISWRGHTWSVSAAIADSDIYSGTLGGTTTATFDPVTGLANFFDLQLSRSGMCPVLFTVTSNPPDYVLNVE
ncbi:hypothetical protein BaRGS_00036740, partial [Batillaria attramentaria]